MNPEQLRAAGRALGLDQLDRSTPSRTALADLVEAREHVQRLWVTAVNHAAARELLREVHPRWWRYQPSIDTMRGAARGQPVVSLGFPIGPRGDQYRVEVAHLLDQGTLVEVSVSDVLDVLGGRDPA